jgi:hypothetical protein
MVSGMNNLIVIRQDGPFQPADDIRLIDDSLPLYLDDPAGKKRVEHRYHQRFQLAEDAFALIRSAFAGPLKIQGKSMGGIACAVFNARPVKLGKIDNISMGGLLFQYAFSNTNIGKALVLDILSADCGFYLATVPYITISDVALPEDVPDDSIDMRQVRLQFQSLSHPQQAKLKDFIVTHGTQIGAIGAED